jgi:hypothetical protein
MREKVPPTAEAIVSADRVFARPGTLSNRTCPPAIRHVSSRSIARSWPTMTFFISNSRCSSTAASEARGSV